MEARKLYRNLLIEARLLIDPEARQIIPNEIRRRFERNKEVNDPKRINHLLREGRHKLNTFTRANHGDKKIILNILEHTYGQRGRLRHKRLVPYVEHEREGGEELIPGTPRSILPTLSPKLVELFKVNNIDIAKLVSDLPTPEHKALDYRRRANLVWRRYRKGIDKCKTPISRDEWETLRGMADGSIGLEVPSSARARRAPPRSTHVHEMTPRLIRRIYAEFLEDIPYEIEDEQGFRLEWGKIPKDLPQSVAEDFASTETSAEIGSNSLRQTTYANGARENGASKLSRICTS